MSPHRSSFQCSSTGLYARDAKRDHQSIIAATGDLRSGKYADNFVSARGSDIFAIKQEVINEQSLEAWELNMDTLVVELKALHDKENLLGAYSSILRLAGSKELTTLQITAFHVLANAVCDALMSLHTTNAPITSLIDDITEVHLDGIDALLGRELVDNDDDTVE